MEFVWKMLSLQLTLFSLILIGILLLRLGIITDRNRKAWSDLLINIVLPCNIVHSFLGEIAISGEFLKNCVLAVVLSALVQAAANLLSRLLFRPFDRRRKNVMTYGMICSNSSFVGLPLAEALFGDLGVLYTSVFQIPIRFTMWTAGLALFTEVDSRAAAKKLIRHPCIIAIAVGFALMVLPVSLPTFALDTITAVSRCTTALSMFVVGSILGETDWKGLLSPAVLYYCFLRLIAFPLTVYLCLLPFGLDETLVGVCVVMTAMPAGSTTSILADKYDFNPVFASQLIFASTLFSVFTIPALGMLL